MSKHLGKIIDLLKAAKQLDMLDSSKDIEYPESEKPVDQNSLDWEKVGDERSLKRFFQDHSKLSEDQYADIISGKMEDYWHRFASDLANNLSKEHNNDASNEKAFAKLQSNIKDLKAVTGENHDARTIEELEESVRVFRKHFNLSSKLMNDAVEDGDESILSNSSFEKNHLYKMMEKHPQHMDEYLDHKHFDERASDMIFSSEEKVKSLDSRAIRRLIQNKSDGYGSDGSHQDRYGEPRTKLGPNTIKAILEHAPDKLDGGTLNVLLDHVDPSYKQEWTNKVLGMGDENGEHDHALPEDYEDEHSFQQDNWDNWSEKGFQPEFNRLGNILAGSRHLTDDQAEHIKRHGEFEEKYSLYNNKHADPKHGAEMFQKWHDDDHEHGYDSDALNAKNLEDKGDTLTVDDLHPDQVEEIRQTGYEDGTIDDMADSGSKYDDWLYHLDDDKVREIMGDEYDDIDEIHEKMHGEGHDWIEENPESKQNIGNPKFDALDKLHQEFEGKMIEPDELKQHTNLTAEELGVEVDEDGDIDCDDITEQLGKFGGPSQVDFSDSQDHTVDEHPEYQERFDSAADEWRIDHWNKNRYEIADSKNLYEDHRESDEYQAAIEEASKEYVEDNAKDHLEELYGSSHQDTRFIPNHLHTSIPNFDELQANNKRTAADGGHGPFFDKTIKDRSYEHAYGEDQHFYEMVKDHAEANNGKIDVGTMNKLYPAQKEKWKKIFAGKGKISSEEASQKLDEIPKTNYNMSFGKWGSGSMQNINGQNQVIFRLDHSGDSIKPLMEDPKTYETFKHVQDVSKQSGHPTNDSTIAWARVDTTDPEHWMIDEVQSDFGKTVTKYLKENGNEEKASHIEKISAIHKDWREALTNSVLKEAKKHGAQKVSTHSPESKGKHTDSSTIHSVYKDSYKKVPRKMGFQPAEMEDLPLTDKGQGSFKGEVKVDEGQGKRDTQVSQHETASDHHTQSADYLSWCKENKEKTGLTNIDDASFDNIIAQHHEKREGHINRALSLGGEVDGFYDIGEHHGPDHLGAEDNADKRLLVDSLSSGKITEHQHDALIGTDAPTVGEPTQEKNLQGHTFNLTPKLLKKHMDDCLEYLEALEKGDMGRAAKGALLALGMVHGAHYIGGDEAQQAKIEQSREAPKHARSTASIEQERDPVQEGYDEAQKDAEAIFYKNDKKHFLKKYSDGLSSHVFKQTIKDNPELSKKYNYVNGLSNNTFKEITAKNQGLRDDVHGAHYDKLHGEFAGDHEQMLHAWTNGIKSTHDKFRGPASSEVGEQPTADTIDKTVNAAPEAPNYTNRRQFRGQR